ncbi:glycosyl hydrolase family 18 protein [Nocardioides ferulae]|uniref:glycosyl hydrolase family 18 protein n=1 Tax=Nocardioides ferulae TaxID=2340821 RepID=UPI0013DE35EA|nr:glycosyl hydrolase family 18 protein [Nocardioides ferulae]
MPLPSLSRLAGALTGVLVLLATPLPAAATAGPDAETPLAVTGYALPSLRPALVRRDAHGLATLTVVGTMLSPGGDGVSRPTAEVRRLREVAHRQGLRAELLLSNWSNALGRFDRRAAHRLLRSRAHVRTVSRQLARRVVAQSWDGVNVDLEGLRPTDGDGLVLLVRRLQRRMPPGREVSVDVSARTTLRGYRAAGYRLGELGRAADVLQLMAYDQHGPTWSDPGPVGARAWQRQSLAAMLRRVPAGRIDLGVAGYGYTWPPEGAGREGRSVTVAGARRRVRADGAEAVWRPKAGEWRARLSDGTVLWWSDRRSLRLRHRLADERGLHGLALWRLGSADPL